METPTPLHTPPVGAKAYRPAAWNEDEAFGLVDIVEQFSFADNLPMPFGDKRFNYQSDQTTIILAAQEALHRFPNTKYKEKLEWRIALANTILDNPDSDEWILKEIEKALNDKRVTLDNLYQLLNQFGFEISQREPAYNLFGNDQLAQVLWITRQDRGYTGLYAALSQDKSGRYTLTKIYSSWDFNFGYDEPFKIEEHTGDDIPEVIMFAGYHNGSFCGYKLVIFQWQEDSFIDVGNNQFSFDECDYPESWNYGMPDKNGREPIETWRSVAFYSGVIRYERYEWNGERFELSESRLVPPEKFDDNFARWVIYAMNEEDYHTIIDKTSQFLSEAIQFQTQEYKFGVSYPDYMRFQLGLAYAFQSDSNEARSIFKQIVQTPQNPSITAISEAARAYLDNYNGDADLYRACQAALSSMGKASGENPFGIDAADYEHLGQAWGYQPDWSWESIVLCNLPLAFNKITAQLDVAQFENAPEQLKTAGVIIRSAVKADLDNDGQAEWVLLTDTSGNDTPVEIWILHNTSTSIQPIPLVSWGRRKYELPLQDAKTAKLEIKTIILPEGDAINLIRAGQHFYIFQLNAAEKSIKQVLWTMTDVENYIVHQQGSHLELEIVTNTEYCRHCRDIYVWFNHNFEWTPSDEPDKFKVLEAETTLLAYWKPNEAIPLLKSIVENTSYHDSPRLMYLLGLSYELIGDEGNTAQIYWKVWHNYPDSVYARLAQAKLELRR